MCLRELFLLDESLTRSSGSLSFCSHFCRPSLCVSLSAIVIDAPINFFFSPLSTPTVFFSMRRADRVRETRQSVGRWRERKAKLTKKEILHRGAAECRTQALTDERNDQRTCPGLFREREGDQQSSSIQVHRESSAARHTPAVVRSSRSARSTRRTAATRVRSEIAFG